jgi:hypothetical protein
MQAIPLIASIQAPPMRQAIAAQAAGDRNRVLPPDRLRLEPGID